MKGKAAVPRGTDRNKRKSRDSAPSVAIESQQTWRRHAWKLGLLCILVFAAYSNSFGAGLVFDSGTIVLDDPRVHAATLQNLGRIFTEGYWVHLPNADLYRPLTTLSYLLNYAVLGNGPNPAGYHWMNLGLHAVNASLVYAVGLLIFGEAGLGLALAAIWALHPLLTDSVTNIVGRADLLAAFGVLAGLLCHVYASGSTGGRKRFWLAGLTASLTIGLFSKENALVLPIIMLLYDLTWPERSVWRDRISSYAALMLPVAVFFALRSQLHTHLEVGFLDNPLVSAGFWPARLTAVKVLGKLLWLFVWPARLSSDYSYNAIPLSNWGDANAWISLAVCAAAIGLAWRIRRTHKPLSFFVFFSFIALAPTANLVILIGSIMAERFMYLPSVGVAGCAVWLIRALAERLTQQQTFRRRLGWAVAGLLCLASGARTYARNTDWHDALTLWTSAVDVNPDDAKAHINLGKALDESGQVAEAVTEYRIGARLDPSNAVAHAGLGSTLSRIPAHLPEAAAELETAVRIDPGFEQAHVILASVLSQIPGKRAEEIAELKAALKIHPDLTAAHYRLGLALAQTPGNLAAAAAEFRTVLMSTPNDPGTHNNLGYVLSQMPGHMQDAIAEWETAVKLDPNLAEAHYQLGMALAQIPGKRAEAIEEIEAAERIRPDSQLQEIVNRLRGKQ